MYTNQNTICLPHKTGGGPLHAVKLLNKSLWPESHIYLLNIELMRLEFNDIGAENYFTLSC
jgi:hypothetical protein